MNLFPLTLNLPMQTIVSLASIKDWLRISDNDVVVNARLNSLLITACTLIGKQIGITLVVADDVSLPEVEEPIKTAVKIRVNAWAENPMGDAKIEKDALETISTLLAPYRKYTYPDTDATI